VVKTQSIYLNNIPLNIHCLFFWLNDRHSAAQSKAAFTLQLNIITFVLLIVMLAGVYVRVVSQSVGDGMVAELWICWPRIPFMLAAAQEEFRPKLETTVNLFAMLLD